MAVVLALAVGTTVSYLKYRETEAALGERNTALGEAKASLDKADEAIKKREYQLGISDFLLAVASYDAGNVLLAAERLAKVPKASAAGSGPMSSARCMAACSRSLGTRTLSLA